MDGSRTPRSEMASRVARWVGAPAQEALWRSRPVQGQIGILFVPETQRFLYAQQGNAAYYGHSMHGVYQGFQDRNIQADWVHVDDMAGYDLIYLPIPVMLAQATADRLCSWVEQGGVLIAEGCPGYFGDGGHVGRRQPNLGLDRLFGVQESYVEFTPDLLGALACTVDGVSVRGGVFLQAYRVTTGSVVGRYSDGRVAAVDHLYGRGRTRLLGTMAGYGYATHPGDQHSAYFARLLAWAGKTRDVTSSDPRVKARLHAGDGGTYLWVANSTRQAIPVRLTLSGRWGPYAACRSLWGAQGTVQERVVRLTAGERDVTILALER
jgi:beta-galactosidase